MKLIVHRRNTLAELRATAFQYGVEVDIRSFGNQLVTSHDPFLKGEKLIDWVDQYKHGTLILNVKEEGLEARLIALMESQGISDYFFLDLSFPFLVKWANAGERRLAVRISEYESISTALSLAGKIDWIWVDCFTHFPLHGEEAQRLQEVDFKLCLVSPELQGRDPVVSIPALMQLLTDRSIRADAVCTKRPDLWESFCTP